MNKQRLENLKRMKICLKYIKKFISSLDNELHEILRIENDMPKFIKDLILQGEKFNIEFDDDYSQYVLHTKNFYDGLLLDKSVTNTNSEDVQADLKYISSVEFSGFLIDFYSNGCAWLIKVADVAEINIFSSEIMKVNLNKGKDDRMGIEVNYYDGKLTLIYDIRYVSAFTMTFELDEQEKALFPRYENNEEFSI